MSRLAYCVTVVIVASSPGQTRVGSELAAPSSAICCAARYSCRPLFIVPVIWPLVSALVRAGTAKAARTAMIEITTSISINVNADWERVFIEEVDDLVSRKYKLPETRLSWQDFLFLF